MISLPLEAISINRRSSNNHTTLPSKDPGAPAGKTATKNAYYDRILVREYKRRLNPKIIGSNKSKTNVFCGITNPLRTVIGGNCTSFDTPTDAETPESVSIALPVRTADNRIAIHELSLIHI